jgi:signal transduction histidine kinase
MPAGVRGSRQQSIRSLLTLALVVPIVCLLGLWALGTSATVGHSAAEHDFAAADRLYSGPAQGLSSALTAERLQAVTWLSSGGFAPLRARFQATDRAAATFDAAATADQSAIPCAARTALRTAESLLAGRAALRADLEAGRLSPLNAVQSYGTILAALISFDAQLLVVDDASLSRQAAGTVAADSGMDLLSGEFALVTSAAAADGDMSTPERSLFVQDMASAQLTMTNAVAVLDPSLGGGYLRARSSAANRRFAAIENEIAATVGVTGTVPIGQTTLAATVVPLSKDYQAAQRQDTGGLTSLATQASDGATQAVVLVAWLGLILVLLSVLLVVRLWWRVSREVTGLRDAAVALASDRLLPQTLGTTDGGGAPGRAGRRRSDSRIAETGTVRAALATAQRLALQVTAAQSQLRSEASQFFQHLGLHNQALAARQLKLLALIDRGTSEPQTRAGLAAVGQLSTRIQRQADGLLVLAGGSPTRDNPKPVLVGDLIRAATADVADPSHITVVSDTQDAVAAEAVADVRQLVAELVDNAVRHTPPLTDVTVRVGRVGRGLAIEVEDRGPGIGEKELEKASTLLAAPPAAGVVVGERLGLLVVSRLAARNGITVTVRRSLITGTTAIVLLPHAVLVSGELRDTIIDGSLPRIDAAMPPPGLPSPGPPVSGEPSAGPPAPDLPPPRLPRRGAPETAQPARRVGPYVPAESPVPAAGDSAAPWHWLTEGQPTRRRAADMPTLPAASPADMPTLPAVPAVGPAGDRRDPGGQTPLPRRIRRTEPPFGVAGRAAPPSVASDQAQAPDSPDTARRDPDWPASDADESGRDL